MTTSDQPSIPRSAPDIAPEEYTYLASLLNPVIAMAEAYSKRPDRDRDTSVQKLEGLRDLKERLLRWSTAGEKA